MRQGFLSSFDNREESSESYTSRGWAGKGDMLLALKTTIKERFPALYSVARKLSARREVNNPAATDAALQYLLDEVSDLRVVVRELAAQTGVTSAHIAQTRNSFSYQWAEITEGKHLLGDPSFEQQMLELIEKYSDLPSDWFVDKSVLDAGCGNGRWSYQFVRLGAKVRAVDQSADGIANLQRLLGDEYDFEARQGDLLQGLPFKAQFDLVWCYGVAHHTGNTRLAVNNVAAAVKPGGRIFLMIYGEPRNEMEFGEINNYVSLRRETQFMSFEEKRDFLEAKFPTDLVHGYFDAISPAINDLHRFDEIEGWLRTAGFHNIRKTLESRNHHLVADRPAT